MCPPATSRLIRRSRIGLWESCRKPRRRRLSSPKVERLCADYRPPVTISNRRRMWRAGASVELRGRAVEVHSYRNAVMGSTRSARTAGASVARSATPLRTPTTARKAVGSDALSPGTRNIASGRVAKNASARPMSIPAPAIAKVCRHTMPKILPGVAPRATRRPISRVRRETEYKTTP